MYCELCCLTPISFEAGLWSPPDKKKDASVYLLLGNLNTILRTFSELRRVKYSKHY
jgi:hypothetical protein